MQLESGHRLHGDVDAPTSPVRHDPAFRPQDVRGPALMVATPSGADGGKGPHGPAPEPAPQHTAAAGPRASRRVLIADDTFDTRESTASISRSVDSPSRP